MALSGLQIYKLLPKTNCKKCGFPTCLAFAMKLAQKGVELSACPDVSEDAKKALSAAARPPIQLVTVGSGPKAFSVGNEVAMFRHEKTFVNPTALAVRVKVSAGKAGVAKTVGQVAGYQVDWVGSKLHLSGVAVEDDKGDAAAFVAAVEQAAALTDLPLILMSKDPRAIEAALPKTTGKRPLIYAATKENVAEMAKLAKAASCPLAVYGKGLDEMAGVVEQASAAGVEELVLDPGVRGFGPYLTALTQLRRLALKANERLAGFPIIAFPGDGAESPEQETLLAGQLVAKYASIVVLDHFSQAHSYALLTGRQNIYTDPQKPIQMEPGLYPIREPKKDSPVLVTTNFSLTYFSVASEVEASGVPAWLVVCNTDGQSVLTSWAAGKFDGERIAKAVITTEVGNRVSHRAIVIPGHVAVLSGEIEEELKGWTILVGPREAIDITGFLKNVWPAKVKATA